MLCAQCLITSPQVSFSFASLIYILKAMNDVEPLLHHSLSELMTAPKEAYQSFEEIVLSNGYQVESHHVTTDDGCINKIFRVYKDSNLQVNNGTLENKPVIFMQHGLADSADTWIINYKDKAPAFVAAEAGYDVWVGNNRGNKYSRMHTHLDPTNDLAYWEHSFSEHSKFDVPASVKYIRRHTLMKPEQKMTYMGHS